MMKRHLILAATTLIICSTDCCFVKGFVKNFPSQRRTGRRQRLQHKSQLWYNDNKDDEDLLYQRINNLRLEIMEEEVRRPPNSNLSPTQLVEGVMAGLLDPYNPLPYSGFRLMLSSATPEWRHKILHSIGANSDSNLEIVASALGEAIGRPHNQFAILVGEGDEKYTLEFSDPLDYQDGTAWVECRLKDPQTGELLVITGWDLRLCTQNNAWLVHTIEWQDFRDEFRPGIGREEWVRECL